MMTPRSKPIPKWQNNTPQAPTVAVLQPVTTTATGATTPGTGSAPSVASVYWGVGAPTFSAPNGSLYLRYDGGAGTTLYVNTSGASTSGTTWTGVTLP